jgi:hypothetical protein
LGLVPQAAVEPAPVEAKVPMSQEASAIEHEFKQRLDGATSLKKLQDLAKDIKASKLAEGQKNDWLYEVDERLAIIEEG